MKRLELLALVALMVGCLLYQFVVAPVERGFFCDDDSIRYPYLETPTINMFVLMVISVGIPLVSFVALVAAIERPSNLKKYFLRWLLYAIPFSYGWLVTSFLTLFTKCHTGRLRPYYLDYCRPNLTALCGTWQLDPTSHHPNISHLYVTLDLVNCTGPRADDYYAARESRLSFFSGHSSLAAYAMFYLAVVVVDQLPKVPVMVRFLGVLVLSNVAFYVGYSRVSDYRHHWSDVLVGLIVGILLAQLTYRLVTLNFLATSEVDIVRQILVILGCDDDALTSPSSVNDLSSSMVNISASTSSLLGSRRSLSMPQPQYKSCGQLVKRGAGSLEEVITSSSSSSTTCSTKV